MQFTQEQIADIQAAHAADPHASHSEIARRLGINRATVARYRLKTSETVSAPSAPSGTPSILELITDKSRTLDELAQLRDCSRGTVLDLLDALRSVPGFSEEGGMYIIRTPHKPLSDQVQSDRQQSRLRQQADTAEQKYKHTLQELEAAEARLQVALNLREQVAPIVLTASKSSEQSEGCAILQASDWHIEERVDPATVNHLNAYNPDIAERRAGNFFQHGLQLIEKERQALVIQQAVLWLGGDLISGYIHDELEESNYLSPIHATSLCQNIIAGGIQFLLKESGLERLIVICNYGNHGRIGAKKRISTGAQNSYEWLMYRALAKEFQSESRLQFQNANGYINYLEVFGYTLRFHHGDTIGYQGGVGGVTIPLNRWIGRSNEQVRADMDFIGHFHQLTFHRNFTINGSLIGFNAYAQSLGASPERPQQGFRLLDSRRGFTGCFPILVQDETERELWQPGFERKVI